MDKVIDKKPVGFIGLGNMGNPMAINLVKKGFPLVIHDINTEAMQKLKELAPDKIQIALSPNEIAAKSKQIITMLPSSSHVRDVYTSQTHGILLNLEPDSLCIDTSTIDPQVAREIETAVNEKKSELVDAPVSGGVVGAENATLTFMVGGSTSSFQRAKELLAYMGKNIVHCGDSGNGQVVKVCNNLALAIEMIGVSEALNLGISLGMDPKTLSSIFNNSTARCWSSDTYNPVPGILPGVPSSRDYVGGFGVDLMLKDIGLALNAASSSGTPVFLGKDALAVYKLLSSNGFGKKDFSSVYQFLFERNKKKTD